MLRIKNWKLSLLAIIFIAIFASLGVWQLRRAEEKQQLLTAFKQRMEQEPWSVSLLNNLNVNKDQQRFHRMQLTGRFDNAHSFLLDNKIFHGKIGYQLYTPFQIVGTNKAILIDRGFIPMTENRNVLPQIQPLKDNNTIIGLLNVPPTYVSFGSMVEAKKAEWPLRIEYMNLKEMSKYLSYELYPLVLSLTPESPGAYAMEWQIVIMPPEKHRAYALQWFAFALTLLILFVVLNRAA